MKRGLKVLFTGLVLAAMLQPATLPACTVCYGGGSDSALGQGMGWGIFALLCTIMTVLAGVAVFFARVIRREAALMAASAEAVTTSKS